MTDATALVPIAAADDRRPRLPQPEPEPGAGLLASLSLGSQPTMFSALANIAAFLAGSRPDERYPKDWADQVRRQAQEDAIDATPWHLLRFQHTMALRSVLAEHYEAGTANKMLTALRQTIATAWRLNLLDTDSYMKAVDLTNLKGDRPEAATGRHLSFGEINALIAASNDGTNLGARDTAIIAVAVGGGLRRSELARLQLEHYRDGAVTVRQGQAQQDQDRALAGRRAGGPGRLDRRPGRPSPARSSSRILKGDHVRSEGLTAHAIQLIIDARRQAANIAPFTPARPAPHLRRRPAPCQRRHRHRAEAAGPQQPGHHRRL